MRRDVDLDDIAFLKQADFTAHRSLRADMADGCTTGRTGETAVGNQCNILIQLHAGQCRGRVKHFAHTRTALRALIANDNDIALVDLAAVNRFDCLFFAVEQTSRAGMLHHFRCNCALLDGTAFLGNVAPQNCNAAGLHVRIVNRTDNLRIGVIAVCDVLADLLAGSSDLIQLDQILFGQLIHNCIDAACLIQLLNVGTACRCQMAQVRRAGRNLVQLIQIQLQTCLMCDGKQMKNRIGRTAQCHFTFQCVVDGLFGDDITRLDVLFQQLHDLHASMLGKLDAVGINRRNRAVARQCHADCLTQAVHRVCGVHAGAGTAARAGMLLNISQLSIVNQVCLARTDCLERVGQRDILAIVMACQHRVAGADDSRDVQTSCRHDHARNDLIAVRDEYKCVKLVCLCERLNRVRNQLTGRQRKLHADVAHCNAVAYADGRNQNRRTASHTDASLDCIGNFVQIDVTRDDLTVRRNDADNRAVHFFLGHAGRTQQRTMRYTLHALRDVMTSQFHKYLLTGGSCRRLKNGDGDLMSHPRLSVWMMWYVYPYFFNQDIMPRSSLPTSSSWDSASI